MRYLFTLLFLLTIQAASAQCCPYLTPVQILPPNPTATDDVRLVFQAMTPCLGNRLGTSFTTVGNSMTFTGCYYSGMLTQPQIFNDTVHVGRLPIGNYSISFIGKISSSFQQCTEIQRNSSTVVLQIGSPLAAKASSTQSMLVYPVPASGRSLSLLAPSDEPVRSLQLLDMVGRESFACAATALVRQGNQWHLNLPALAAGAYILKTTLVSGRLLTQRITLE